MSFNSRRPLEPAIGAFVLESVTTGMYTNPLDVIREYVQNACDSIGQGKRNHLIRGRGGIEIVMDTARRSVTIRDNGLGVPSRRVVEWLVNVGFSPKNGKEAIGFRGIGRLAGLAYCEQLVFRTQAVGETRMSEVRFNCTDLRSAMVPVAGRIANLSTVLAQAVDIHRKNADTDSHFFEVTLSGITPQGSLLLDWPSIHSYLSQTAPVDYDEESFPFARQIRHWARARRISIPAVRLTISVDSKNIEVFKPYQSTIYKAKRQNQNIVMKNINFYPEDANNKSPFWLWYADTNLPGTFADEAVAGLRLRKGNMSLGLSEEMTNVFGETSSSNARFNNYLMGEIHIQDSETIPNGRRDGFEPNHSWLQIKTALRDFAALRSREIRKVSVSRTTPFEEKGQRSELPVTYRNTQEHRDDTAGITKASTVSQNGFRSGVQAVDSERRKPSTAPRTDPSSRITLDTSQYALLADLLTILSDLLDPSAVQLVRQRMSERYSVPAGEDGQ